MRKFKVKLFYISLLLLVFLSDSECRTIEVKCSEFCTCDTYQNLRRATCQNKRLISLEINMAPEVEILDLGFNYISEFGDRIFKELNITSLKLLNVTRNKISHIHFNAFEGLTEVKTLDLSFNALRYITKFWFKSLKSLQELYLRGNLLRTINEQHLIESKSLKVLDLSECGLTHLKKDIFSKALNLEILDLSGNFFVEFRTDIVKHLNNLTVLNLLLNNNLDCKSKTMMELKSYRKNKGFALKQPCNEKMHRKSHMFERMIMQTDIEPDLNKNSWVFEISNQEPTVKTIKVCNNMSTEEKFRKSFSIVDFDGFLMQIVSLSPIGVLCGLFGYGIFIGLLCGCLCRCNLKKKRKKGHFVDDNSELPDGATTFNNNLSRHSLTSNYNRYSYVDYINCLDLPSTQLPNVKDNQTDKNANRKKIQKKAKSFTSQRSYNEEKKEINATSRQRSNSFVRQLFRSKSTGSRPLVKKEEGENLMRSEFDLANSTPMTPRRLYVLPNNVFEETTSE